MSELQSNESIVGLENIAQGAAIELFNIELQKIIQNVIDPNTDPKAKREIVVKVTLLPSEDRRQANVTIAVNLKLAGHIGSGTRVYFGTVRGKQVAVESAPGVGLFDKPDGKLKTVPITKGGE